MNTHLLKMIVSVGCALGLLSPVLGQTAASTGSPPGAQEVGTPPAYRPAGTIALPGPERWDYLQFDPTEKRLYVSHGDHVTVIDASTNQIVGQIGTFPGGTHGIAVAHAAGLGFTDDGKAGVAIAFSLKTLKPVARIKTAEGADGIAFDPASNQVFVINGDSGSVTAIDPKKRRAVATIKVGSGLEFGVADGAGSLYVNGAELGDVVRIDTKKHAVVSHWPLANCEKPHGIAIDTAHRRLFVTCVNQVMVVVNADTGAPVTSLPIGAHTDAAAFDSVRGRAFSSNGDGTLSVVQEESGDQYRSLPAVVTAPTARTMTLDPATGRLYLVAADPAPPQEGQKRRRFVPGSLRVLMFDPAP